MDELRRRNRQPVRIGYLADLDPRTTESAENAAVAALGTEAVRRLLDTLPDDQRAVIALRVIADLSINQVGEILGRSPGAVKQLQRRGLLALRGPLVAPGQSGRDEPHPQVTSRGQHTMTGSS